MGILNEDKKFEYEIVMRTINENEIYNLSNISNSFNLTNICDSVNEMIEYEYLKYNHNEFDSFQDYKNKLNEYLEEIKEVKQDKIYKYQRTEDFIVSAWAMWNVVVEYLGYLREGALTATKIGEDGKLTKEVIDLAKCNYKFYLGSLYGAIEIPYPEATGHYVEGHGHAHGGDNAGGGISFNE